jgi:putative transposase
VCVQYRFMSEHHRVTLAEEQRASLTAMIRTGSSPARVQTRARILLLSDRSLGGRRTQKQISEALQVCELTIGTICRRFVREGMDAALYEKPRPGQTPKITGEVDAHLTMLACSDPPDGHARWTMQLLADKLIELGLVESISDTAVCDHLKKMRLSRGRSSGIVLGSPPHST